MAQTLEQLKNQILTSIHGRRLGFDKDNSLVGPVGIKQEVTALTSANLGSYAMKAYGIYSINATTLSTQAATIAAPIPGVSVTIMQGYNQNGSTVISSGSSVKRVSAAFDISSCEGSTMTTIGISSRATVTLVGVTSTLYQVTSRTVTSNVYLNGTT